MNIPAIRDSVPLTSELIYFDNASTSLVPREVVEAMSEFDLQSRANVGRGIHRLSQVSSQLYWDAHQRVSRFIGGQEGVCVFGKNTTEAINQVAHGFPFEPGDHVITTTLEHHSNLLPWMSLREQGVSLDYVYPDRDGFLDPEGFQSLITEKTRMIAVTHVSNVLGTIQPVQEICSIAKDHSVKILVDGAQSVPHLPIDVKKIGCDYFCFSGHKMLGPTGIGVLWMKEPDLKPLMQGGGMIKDVSLEGYELEDGYTQYEAGTPHITGAVGLREAVRLLESIGMDTILQHEQDLTRAILPELASLDGVTVYGPVSGEDRLAVVSFTIDGMHPHEVAHLLDDQYSIMVRSGHHCCMPLMEFLNLPDGIARASLYLYNTREECESFLAAIRETTEGV